ncbi:TIR-only protein-like [Andrographis paniculata]|uniref:TIR-only protein-like n=1 Tax=Andrographis paniculata TaxID=175694 RepID=UPI0021E94578|nr:TIR-only protein-like [Andrographis paniculata]
MATLTRSVRRNRNQILHTHRIIRTATPNPNPNPGRACDVFINHRGKDTKRNVASLLYQHLFRLRLTPFLDNMSMKPGDKLFDKIHAAVNDCKLGVAVFSPRYCRSYFCLHELALMIETKKKLIPIFCDVRPSDLAVVPSPALPSAELRRFAGAVEEAKYTVGLEFDSRKGNLADVVKNAADIVIENLLEIDDDDERGHNDHSSKSLQIHHRRHRHGPEQLID